MLHGDLKDIGSYAAFFRHPAWETAFRWLKDLPPGAALGSYEILGRRMFASIQSYETAAREQCRFESHQDHIDLQYTIEGVEAIDWAPRSGLTPDGPFENDVQFWEPPTSPFTTLGQSAGRFAIFLPEDAHRPKVAAISPALVRKLVIKIRRELME